MPGPATSESDHRLDLRLLRRIIRLVVPFWRRPQSWPAWLGLAATFGQGALMSYLVVRAAALLKIVTDALLALDPTAFETALVAFVLVTALKRFLPQANFIVDGLIQATWSRWLTNHVIDQYLARRAYHDVALRGDLDNPDQRIADSVAPFVAYTILMVQWTVNVVARLGAAVAVFLSIDERFLFVVPLLGLAQVGASALTIPPVVRRRIALQVAEGDLRRGLVQIRDHAEAIAFYGGEALEKHTLMGNVRAAADKYFRLDRLQALQYVTIQAGLALGWMALPYLVLGNRITRGEVSYGALAEATAITLMMRNVVSTLSNIVAGSGELALRVARLAPLQERFDERAREEARPGASRIALRRGGARITVEGLSLQTPDGTRQLVRALDLTVARGESLVIVGETGVGKSSLLRAMAGLWTRGQGRIVMPPSHDTLFLPQRPYFPGGSLRAQLLYPQNPALSDADLQEILAVVRLPDLVARHGGLSAVKDWSQILSGGEQQRVAFARWLIARPGFVFLDEATSALDPATEMHLYELLARSGASYVSVGHRSAIIAHHTHILTLAPGGGWKLAPVAVQGAEWKTAI